jgi:hypothetical protein
MSPLVLLLCLAADPTPKGPKPETPAGKVRTVLNETGYVVLENKSLTDFVAYVKSKTRADVVLDHGALAMIGMDVNAPSITISVRDVPLREGFAQALAPLGLRIGNVGGTIVISSEEGLISRQMRQRVSIAPGPAGAVLGDLAAKTGANVVIDPRQKKVIAEAGCDLELNDVPLETAVRLAAEVSGFRALRMGNVLFVTSNERAKELRPDSDGPASPQLAIPNFLGGVEDRPGGFPVPIPIPPGGGQPPQAR